jgi:hypothetical protein
MGLTDCSLGVIRTVELDDSSTSRSSTRLVLDFCTLDLTNGGEQLDEIFVTGGPGQLDFVSTHYSDMETLTHVSHIDDLALLSS